VCVACMSVRAKELIFLDYKFFGPRYK